MALERIGEKGWRVRLRYGSGARVRLMLPPALTKSAAELRALRLGRMASMLARAGRPKQGRLLLERAAESADHDLSTVEEVARELCAEVEAEANRPEPTRHQTTFREVCDMWMSGELHRLWPDVVGQPGDRAMAAYSRVLRLVCREIGKIPVAKVTLDDAERAKAIAPTLQRHLCAALIRRVMALAEYPLRLIDRSPIPKKFVPAQGKLRAFSFLYPDEDLKLLKCAKIPVQERLLYGVLAREGFRISEAIGLRWRDIDVAKSVVKLDKNKTRTPRAWLLSPGVLEALLAHKGAAAESDLVFGGTTSKYAATRFRDALREAGVARAELFEKTSERRPIRIHDLRGTFVTIALATGKTEAFVMDRTGHTTSAMLGRYRRSARHAAEIGLGCLARLDVALGLRSAEPEAPPSGGDPLDLALANALEKATAAGEWKAVRELARELNERRRKK